MNVASPKARRRLDWVDALSRGRRLLLLFDHAELRKQGEKIS